MAQFSEHALERFQKRAPKVFLPGSSIPTAKRVAGLARMSFDGGRMVTRQEASQIIKAPIRRRRSDVYKEGAEGRGIWVVRLLPDGGSVITTYLAPYRLRTWNLPRPCPLGRRRVCA